MKNYIRSKHYRDLTIQNEYLGLKEDLKFQKINILKGAIGFVENWI